MLHSEKLIILFTDAQSQDAQHIFKKTYSSLIIDEKSQGKTSLRFKIKNELQEPDYRKLTEFLKDNPSTPIELFPGTNLGLVDVSPALITIEGLDFKIQIQVLFEKPIGLEVLNDLRLDNELSKGLEVNRRNFKLSRIVAEPTDLANDVNLVIKAIEHIVNHICNRLGVLIEHTITIGSEALDKQLERMIKKEELENRGEIPRPFGTIHADSTKDAKERAGELVPIYMERDKTYLYEEKKVFILLPRNFAMKLLKIEGPTMMPVDQFTEEEKETLKKFSIRQYIKTSKVAGKAYYYDLDETTRKLLLKAMQKRPYSPSF